MKKTLTVLLIEDSPDYAALVQQWLSVRTDTTFILNWTDSLQAGLSRLKQGGIDVILLDLGLPDSNGIATYTRIKLQAPGAPVILLSGDTSEELALEMVRDGAQDYIVKSSCSGDLLAKAIQFAVVRADSRAEQTGRDSSAEPTSIIAVMGVKGGVGSTTIACNLAVELRGQTEKKTLLADLDLECGMVGFLMSATSEYSVLDAAGNVDRLDVSFWEGLVARGAGDVDVLRSPSQPGGAQPDGDHLSHVLAMIRKLYRWAVVDIGRPSEFSLGLLDKVNELFLVTSTSVPALYQTKQALAAVRKAGFDGDQIRMIVNQISNTQEFSASELDRLFGVPVYARFPFASQELHNACVQKALLGKNNDFRMKMASLARRVAGLQPEKQRSKVSQMFSRSEKPTAVESNTA